MLREGFRVDRGSDDMPEAERAAVISAAWHQIQRCLAFGNAAMVLSAA